MLLKNCLNLILFVRMERQKIQEQQILSFDPQHSAMPHDIKLDSYGKLLATCSSQGRVNIFRLSSSGDNLTPRLIATTNRHKGPVYQVQWSPPSMGCLLASCGDDGQVIVHKVLENDVKLVYKSKSQHPVTSISWCGLEGQLILASITTLQEIRLAKCYIESWTEEKHPQAVIIDKNSPVPEFPSFLAWSPPSDDQKTYLLVAQNNVVGIFKYSPIVDYGRPNFEKVKQIKIATDNIRDVTWEQSLTNQILRPIVLLEDKIIIFEDIKLEKQEEVKILDKSSSSFTLKLGWSDSGTRLNVYCIEGSTFTTKSLKCSFNGVWHIVK